MGTEVDKKQWVTIVDFLRLVTPLAVGLLVYQVETFQTSLEKNTAAIEQQTVTLARMDEKQQRMADDVKDNHATISTLKDNDSENKREIQGLALRFAALESTKGR